MTQTTDTYADGGEGTEMGLAIVPGLDACW